MAERIRFYVHATARQRAKTQALDISSKLQGARVEELKFPVSPIPDSVETVVVVGGDGSVRAVTESMLDRDNPGTLIVTPAGSLNGFYQGLMNARAVMPVAKLGSGELEIQRYYPGEISNKPFIHLAGWGRREVLHARYSEELRGKMPRELRPYGAVIFELLTVRNLGKDSFYQTRFAMTTPHVGALKIYPSQEFYGNTVTVASMRAENKRQAFVKFLVGYVYALCRQPIPRSIIDFSTNTSFSFPNENRGEANLDGQVLPIPKQGTIYIARNKKGVQAAALVR